MESIVITKSDLDRYGWKEAYGNCDLTRSRWVISDHTKCAGCYEEGDIYLPDYIEDLSNPTETELALLLLEHNIIYDWRN